VLRREVDPGIWDHFEYMAAISRDFNSVSPTAPFPPGLRRMPVDDSLVKRLYVQTDDAR